MRQAGAHRVTVPGAVAGWQALHDKFGTMKFDRLLAPAIYYARTAIRSPKSSREEWASHGKSKAKQPGFAETYLPGGRAPKTGEVFKNPALAESLKLVAEKGRDGFYTGVLAGRLVDFLKEQGGVMALADLAEFQPEWVDPISTTYRGWKVCELPPNTQGIAALAMLNIMEHFPLGRIRPQQPTRAARDDRGEEARLRRHAALRRRSALRKDPGGSQLLDKDFAGERAKLIDHGQGQLRSASCRSRRARRTHGNDTIYLSAIDKRRQHRFADPEQLRRIRHGAGRAGHRLRAPESRRPVHARSRASRTRSRRASGRCTRIIPAFMEKGDVTSASASWAAGTRRRRTRSSSRTSSISE